MKKIEVLYSEFGNMYGEVYNAMFLDKASDDVELIYTKLSEEPHFVKHNVDMIYMGNVRDKKTYDILARLKEYKEQIKELIENDTVFLLTGNALEMFGAYIDEDGKKTEGLKLFDYYIEKDFNVKYASWVMGMFEDANIEIIGHRNQFSKCHNITQPFIKVSNGSGSSITSNIEGIHYKNFFATYLLGPFLIMNPLFTKYILGLIGITEMRFEDCAMESYLKRMECFHKKDARFIMNHFG